MKLKYKVRKLVNGKWAVWQSKSRYFTNLIFDTEKEAIQASLSMEGHDLIEKLDDVQKRMESIPGFIDDRDPYGWRA